MERIRIIPFLLIHKGGLYKTTNFTDPKYVGDPINAVKIFNEKSVDEIFIVDIDASSKGNEINFKLIKDLASECRMPMSYGGGVTKVSDFEKLVSLGVEKIAISSAAIKDMSIVKEASEKVGNQSVVVVLDIKRKGFLNKQEMVFLNAKKKTNLDPIEFAVNAEKMGAGEIVINSVNRDGTMKGYDLKMIQDFYDKVSTPITVIGGASDYKDFVELGKKFPVIGAGAGSLFVFKGKYRAVLINYPSLEEKNNIINEIREYYA